MTVRQPPGHISISSCNQVPAASEPSPSGNLDPNDHIDENPESSVDSPGSRNNETGYFGTALLECTSADRTTQLSITHQPSQYHYDALKAVHARGTVISGISGFSGVTSDLGGTTGSDPGAPMLPGNLKSAFDDDFVERPKTRVVLCGIKRSNFFILLVLTLFLIGVGVTVGVGVGLGMSKTSNSSPFSEQPQETTLSVHSTPTPIAGTDVS